MCQEEGSVEVSPREEQGLTVLVSVITSCLQTLRSCDAKLAALELVLHLAPRLAVDVLLDRITPYLLHFCGDGAPRVRAQAVRTLAKVLALVKEVPRNDVNIYPEYILPGIAHLAQDEATVVRLAYAGTPPPPPPRPSAGIQPQQCYVITRFLFDILCLTGCFLDFLCVCLAVSLTSFVFREHRPPGGDGAALPGAGAGEPGSAGGRRRQRRRGRGGTPPQ